MPDNPSSRIVEVQISEVPLYFFLGETLEPEPSEMQLIHTVYMYMLPDERVSLVLATNNIEDTLFCGTIWTSLGVTSTVT